MSRFSPIVIILLSGLSIFVLWFLLTPQLTVRVGQPPPIHPLAAWSKAAREAQDYGKIDLLRAMFESQIPEAQSAVRGRLSDLPASLDALGLLHTCFTNGDARTKYHAMHGLYNIGQSLGMDMRKRGVVFPAYNLFQADSDRYISKWAVWMIDGYPELVQRVKTTTENEK